VGLLKPFERSFTIHSANLETPPDIRHAAVKENHRQHLEKAKEALDSISLELREFTNLTFSMNADDVSKAKKSIRKFVDQFERDFEKKPSDQVFQLNMQLYPLTITDREKK